MQVEVVRSPRRSRTVALRPTENGVRISIPAWASKAEEEQYVRDLVAQYERKLKKTDVDLEKRAKTLAARYKLQTPSSIEWSSRSKSRWGSCNVQTGNIRVAVNVKRFPGWVLDYVVVHELAHLSYGGHGPRFWSLVNRYPKTERAIGYLIAKGDEGLDDSEEPPDERHPASAEQMQDPQPEPEIDLRDSKTTLF